jgi:hypothetical protein
MGIRRGRKVLVATADYVWQFNDFFGDQTVEQTTPTSACC